jgi:predicted ATPase/class 3 adenylate cyclase
MPQFPAGTVTFLFTDIEQSTKGWERDAVAARVVVERHLALIRHTVETYGGVHFKTVGDETQSAFATAPQGVSAALHAQRALLGEPWPSAELRPRVRMALHAGTAEPRDGDYLAACLNRLSRLLDAAHGEQILLSSTVAGLAREALPEAATLEALGEYRLRDILQPEEIFQLCHPELRQDFPPLNTPGHLPHNLPTHPTPFLGRETEVDEITALVLRPEVRLVTLTGPGGVGKTRLGMRVAAEVLESFPDGAFLIDLARLTDPELVASATATALGLREQPGQSLSQTLAEYLRELRILLLFDNFEHVLPAAPLVAELLASAPRLKVLATSRARLGLQAEHEYRVEPMPIPDQESLPPLAELTSFDAIELFTSRAQALRPGFTLTEENAPVVAEIVCQLDGLPLAIELAAARVKLLSPAALRDRLNRRLSTLTGGARDLPARQQTLRDTIAWSHDLLAPPEKTLFRRLSVFVGGWTIEAAEVMAAVEAGETVDVFQALATLVDQSLVDEWSTPATLADEPRYGMLETIREFASEQLAASGEIIEAERAFEEFLIARTEVAVDGLKGPDPSKWLDRLEAEHDNIRAALGRALERNDGAVALRLAPRLWEFWWGRGYPREGRVWLERTVALAGSSDMAGRAAAEFGLGRLSLALADYDAAEAHYRKSLEARRQIGDPLAEAQVLSALAMIAVNRLAYDEARVLGEDALKIFQERGDHRGVATAMNVLGMTAREQGEYERALDLFEESVALWRAVGDSTWTARIASQIGITHRLAGNVEQAQHFLDVSRELHTELGDRYSLAVIASHSGHLAFDGGDVQRAITLYAEALRHFDSVDESEGVVEAIEFLAVAVAAKGDVRSALRLFGAAAAAREALHLPPRLESDERRVAPGVDQAMRAAGISAMAVLAEGKTLGLGQARDEALELARVASGAMTRAP